CLLVAGERLIHPGQRELRNSAGLTDRRERTGVDGERTDGGADRGGKGGRRRTDGGHPAGGDARGAGRVEQLPDRPVKGLLGAIEGVPEQPGRLAGETVEARVEVVDIVGGLTEGATEPIVAEQGDDDGTTGHDSPPGTQSLAGRRGRLIGFGLFALL